MTKTGIADQIACAEREIERLADHPAFVAVRNEFPDASIIEVRDLDSTDLIGARDGRTDAGGCAAQAMAR